jgi:hypothetical protein
MLGSVSASATGPHGRIKKNGEICDVLLNAILERGPDGAPLRSLAVLFDSRASRRSWSG